MGQLVRSLAAARRARELFKTLKKVQVTANPFDERAVTAREFLRRVRTRPVLEANPKLQVDFDKTEDYGTASVHLTYNDGSEQQIMTGGMSTVDLLDEVERVARWKSPDAHNPFDRLRAARRKQLGL